MCLHLSTGLAVSKKSALYKAIKNGLKHHNGTMSFSYLEDELNDVSQKQAETVLSKIQPFLDLEPFAEDEEFDWGETETAVVWYMLCSLTALIGRLSCC